LPRFGLGGEVATRGDARCRARPGEAPALSSSPGSFLTPPSAPPSGRVADAPPAPLTPRVLGDARVPSLASSSGRFRFAFDICGWREGEDMSGSGFLAGGAIVCLFAFDLSEVLTPVCARGGVSRDGKRVRGFRVTLGKRRTSTRAAPAAQTPLSQR
jgi:hypothetical protein